MVKNSTSRLKKERGRKNLSKDIVRMKIMIFLKSGSSNQNKISHEAKGISGQPWNTMKNILDEMCEWNWINKKQSEDVANVTMYSLSDVGQKVVDVIDEFEVEGKFEEFFKLDFFQGIKSE